MPLPQAHLVVWGAAGFKFHCLLRAIANMGLAALLLALTAVALYARAKSRAAPRAVKPGGGMIAS